MTFSPQDRCHHPIHGPGIITDLLGMRGAKARVRFDRTKETKVIYVEDLGAERMAADARPVMAVNDDPRVA